MPKLPEKFEDWTPPWEVKEEEFDADTAAKLIFNLKREQEKTAADHATKVTDLQSKFDAAVKERDEKATKVNELEDAQIKDADERRWTQFQREIAELKKALLPDEGAASSQGGTGVTDADRLRAVVNTPGLTEADAARLQGSTYEEILADAKTLSDRLAGASDAGDDGDFIDRGVRMGYADPSDGGEMPSGVPSRQGHRSNLGGVNVGRGFDPAKERDALPRR